MNKQQLRAYFLVCLIGASALFIAGCDAGKKKEEASTYTHSYNLPADSIKLYPDASWLPDTYKKYYPDLAETIRLYTRQSLDNDGLKSTTVSVDIQGSNAPQVTLTGPDKQAILDFAQAHQAFLNEAHAVQGSNGVQKCQQTKGCWDPNPNAQYPWALFLPFGMAMINQPLVNFMNYPPAVSLEQKNYLDNNTMRRWTGVLEAVGISNAAQYETIVDGRPIAAAGSGQADYMPDIKTYFNSQGNEYVSPMISLLAPSKDKEYSKAVTILGTPAAAEWAKIIGVGSIMPGDVGTTTTISSGKKTNWVAGNHPNVTSYQCCPGDPSKNCKAHDGYPVSDKLVPDEQTDLMVACIEKGLGENPGADVTKLQTACKSAWNPPTSIENQTTLCIRARLDYSWDGIGNCKTKLEAVAFCKAHDNNACAANPQGVPYKCGE